MRYNSRDLASLIPDRRIPLQEAARLDLARRGLATFVDTQVDTWYRWFYNSAPMPALKMIPLP